MLRRLAYSIVQAAVLLSLLFVSCTQVDFSDYKVGTFDEADDLAKNQKSEISFDIDWPSEVASNDAPMYVTVVMNRLQNTSVHYVFSLDRSGNYVGGSDNEAGGEAGDGETGDGDTGDGETGDSETGDSETGEGETGEGETGDGETGEIPEDDGTSGGEDDPVELPGEDLGGDSGEDTGELPGDGSGEDTGEGPMEEPENPLTVHNGYYSVAAVAVTDPDDLLYTDVESFGESVEFRMREVYLNIPKVPEDDLMKEEYIDFNPIYPYLRPIGSLYYVRPSGDTHTLVTTTGSNVITLEPVKLTRNIKFSVNLNTEPGVVITKCIGTISGVPGSVQLLTGNVSNRNTAKVSFDMENVSGTRYEGSANVLGLFPSEDPALIVGPGILTVIVHANVEDQENSPRRIFYANLNLMKQIQDADVMRRTEDMSGYVFTDKASFDISADKVLNLTKDMVMTGIAEGYEDWHGNDNAPEEHPGLNPEL